MGRTETLNKFSTLGGLIFLLFLTRNFSYSSSDSKCWGNFKDKGVLVLGPLRKDKVLVPLSLFAGLDFPTLVVEGATLAFIVATGEARGVLDFKFCLWPVAVWVFSGVLERLFPLFNRKEKNWSSRLTAFLGSLWNGSEVQSFPFSPLINFSNSFRSSLARGKD